MSSVLRSFLVLACLAPAGGVTADEKPPAMEFASMEVALEKRDVGTYYIQGALQGLGDLNLLVDTGSSYLVINEAMLAELKKSGSAKFARELSGTMADGSRKLTPIYRLSGLRLGENCWISDVEAAVIPGSTRAILGMNVLSRLSPFTFSTEPAKLMLSQCLVHATGDMTASTR
jgi:clan AA aspartic protease (TIGR02281 family)